MITDSSVDYTGRTVDLSIFPSILNPGVPADMSLGDSPVAIAGPGKAAQGFVLLLFTPLGEMPESPDIGTNFMSKMLGGGIRYPSDLAHIFLMESARAVDQWNGMSASRPLDEQIKDLTLVDLVIKSADIEVTAALVTRGGDVIKFLLPVNWTL